MFVPLVTPGFPEKNVRGRKLASPALRPGDHLQPRPEAEDVARKEPSQNGSSAASFPAPCPTKQTLGTKRHRAATHGLSRVAIAVNMIRQHTRIYS